MSIEMKNGTFTPPEPFDQSLLTRFKDLADAGEAHALHVGTLEDLSKVFARKSLETRIADLESKVSDLEDANAPAPESVILTTLHVPTSDEIRKIMESIK